MAGSSDPFSDNDLKIILDEETCNAPEKGWKFVKKTNDGDEVWRKSVESSSVNLIKGFLNFPGIPPSDILEMITNLKERKKWEKRFTEIDVLEEHPTHKVVYWRVAMPVGVSDRDIVQVITQRRDESQDMSYILYKNATHPSRPEIPNVVRAETILSGTLIRPDKDDPNSSRVTLLLQNDAKGWIPAFLVNTLTGSAPLEWKQSLSDHYHKEYKK